MYLPIFNLATRRLGASDAMREANQWYFDILLARYDDYNVPSPLGDVRGENRYPLEMIEFLQQVVIVIFRTVIDPNLSELLNQVRNCMNEELPPRKTIDDKLTRNLDLLYPLLRSKQLYDLFFSKLKA